MENAGTSARERLTLIRLFEELRVLGYEGGYDAVRRYARAWSREVRDFGRLLPFGPVLGLPGDPTRLTGEGGERNRGLVKNVHIRHPLDRSLRTILSRIARCFSLSRGKRSSLTTKPRSNSLSDETYALHLMARSRQSSASDSCGASNLPSWRRMQ